MERKAEMRSKKMHNLSSILIWSVLCTFGALLHSVIQSAYAQAPAPGSASAHAGAAGTRFLVRLEDKLSTKKDKAGKKFDVKTLEPVVTADGRVIPAGTKIQGHVTRIEPARVTGRARLWLTFDDIKPREGRTAIVADIVGVPGEHSVRAGESGEGAIESRTSRGQRQAEAAATGAVIGAVAGGAARGGKGAAIGAVVGAAAAFLISSGMGQEIELPKGTKFELELARPIYLAHR
jgi:hypothetical protein